MAVASTLSTGQRAKRNKQITVIEWSTGSGLTTERAILGTRVESSSISLNPDSSTITDILGQTFTDVNKTEPTQDFSPYPIIGGDAFAEKLLDLYRRNAVDEMGQFTVYQIYPWMKDSSAEKYAADKQTNCTVVINSLGGDSYLDWDIELHYSNIITAGTVDKLSDDFEFTADS